jgi:hypothetical protein
VRFGVGYQKPARHRNEVVLELQRAWCCQTSGKAPRSRQLTVGRAWKWAPVGVEVPNSQQKLGFLSVSDKEAEVPLGPASFFLSPVVGATRACRLACQTLPSQVV